MIAIGVALLLGALLVWDVSRESDVAVQRLLYHQRMIARALAQGYSRRLAQLSTDDAEREQQREALLLRMLPEGRTIEREGHSVLLVKVPGRAGLRTTDGGVIASPVLEAALARDEHGVALSRDEASAIGLPHRSAVAAISHIEDSAGLAPIAIVMASSSREERDRFRNYEYRLAGGLALTAAIVAAFVALLFREQRRELVMAATLERDEQLARAERMASVAALSLGIGHELATPLGVILGRVEEIGRGSDVGTQRALRSIEDQVARIRRVLQGFLSLARGDAPAMESVKAVRVADDATALVRHRFASAGVELVMRTECDASVRCDAALLTQVLVNLLVNACAHSRASDVVQLSVERRGASVAFVVTDNGTGIAPDVADRATEPFFTTRKADGGTGLGLTIAREIVQHHGGTLQVAPRDGTQGTQAVVTVPAEQTDA